MESVNIRKHLCDDRKNREGANVIWTDPFQHSSVPGLRFFFDLSYLTFQTLSQICRERISFFAFPDMGGPYRSPRGEEGLEGSMVEEGQGGGTVALVASSWEGRQGGRHRTTIEALRPEARRYGRKKPVRIKESSGLSS